jgi:hypothetical protein
MCHAESIRPTLAKLLAALAIWLLSAPTQAGPPAAGPLRVSTANPRYFTDGSGKTIFLAAAHTWANLQDIGFTDPPPAFDYAAHLDFLQRHHHNFIRLWRWELSRWTENRDKRVRYCTPHPWRRAGPGKALDGKPRFDLEQWDPAYFERLRSRVKAAGERGTYVSIMLFEGWGLTFASWDGHPFNVKNNVQGINGDPDGDGKGLETQALKIPAVTRLQEAYVRKVIDTVNDLDNVLFEIANESNFTHSKEWQYHMIRFIKSYEKSQPKQHLVGMTGMFPTENKVLFDSPADWISPGGDGKKADPYRNDPPAADGKKVILLDTDHIWGVGGSSNWAWKSFLRGYNPIWMDPYDKHSVWEPLPANAEDVRRSLGDVHRWAERVNLAEMTPHNDLASTKFCLGHPGFEYLVYLPKGGTVTVDLSRAQGLERFEREARLLGSLNHPNIATLHDFGETDGVRFLIMELVPGPTLAERLVQGRLQEHEALVIAKQIAEALEAAHDKGVIHRDLKPANIKLTHEGRVKILDFGLAKAVGPDTGRSHPTIAEHTTQEGMILGTPGYNFRAGSRTANPNQVPDDCGVGLATAAGAVAGAAAAPGVAQVQEDRALDTFPPQRAPEAFDLTQRLRPSRRRHDGSSRVLLKRGRRHGLL